MKHGSGSCFQCCGNLPPARAIYLLPLILAGCGSAFGQAPAVLNLSHDLVANGIAGKNMVPNSPALDSRPLFTAGVAYASKNHIPTVIADRGSYYFLTQNSPYQHVFLNAIANVTVDLQYSDLYFALGNIDAIDATNCVNLTLRNFTVDYLQLPFTQLTVTGVNAAARTVSVKQLGNYALPTAFNSVTVPPNVNDDGFFAFAFRGGQELRTTGRMPAATPTSDTLIQITGSEPWTQAASLATIQPGDTLVFNHRAGGSTIFANTSAGFKVQNVSI